MNNIKNISVNETTSRTVLYQYDKGQYLAFIESVENGKQVLLSNRESKKAERKIVIDNKVEIPDELLLVAGTLTVNVQMVDEHSETTIKTIKIHILPRKEGNEGITEENKQTFVQQMQQIMNDTKSIAEDIQTRANNGEFDGDDYALTEEDKKEIAGMVEDKGGGTSNYNDLEDKPQINGVELKDNKTAQMLGLQTESMIFDSYANFVDSMLSASNNTRYSYPRYIHIKDNNVPDLWIVYVSSIKNYPTYTSDEQFIEDIKATGTLGLQVGYCYVLLAGGEFVTPEKMKNAIEDAIGNAIGGAY